MTISSDKIFVLSYQIIYFKIFFFYETFQTAVRLLWWCWSYIIIVYNVSFTVFLSFKFELTHAGNFVTCFTIFNIWCHVPLINICIPSKLLSRVFLCITSFWLTWFLNWNNIYEKQDASLLSVILTLVSHLYIVWTAFGQALNPQRIRVFSVFSDWWDDLINDEAYYVTYLQSMLIDTLLIWDFLIF